MKKTFLTKRRCLLLFLLAALAWLKVAQLQGALDYPASSDTEEMTGPRTRSEIQNVFIGPMGPPSYPVVPTGAGVPTVPTSPRMPPGPPPPLPQMPAIQGNESSSVNPSLLEESQPTGLPFGPMEYLQRLKDEAEKEAKERRKKAMQEEEDDAVEGI